MCGIVGVASSLAVDPELVRVMRDDLVHRGPDHGGLWQSGDGRVCFGHRRLAVIDLSPEANQPFISGDRRLVITFNGEIYNFGALRAELEAGGARFRTRCDTEVLLESYRRWGVRCLDRISGMFSFVIFDVATGRLFCARDRAGEKPFHYAVVNGDFYFASELKALLRAPGLTRELNHEALVDYLSFGCVVDPKTIWKGCHKLPPGHWMSVDIDAGGSVRVGEPRCYWDFEPDPGSPTEDWSERIRGTLTNAARDMSFADVTVGTFLSGGVDSSSVTAALSHAGCTVSTFTIGFDGSDQDERPWAREVARRYGTDHHERVVEPDDMERVMERILWHYDEPFNDSSYLPTYYVCREARSAITVALSGDGGDELFGGYRKYQRLALRAGLQRFVPATAMSMLASAVAPALPRSSGLRRTTELYGADPGVLLEQSLVTSLSAPAIAAAARGPLLGALRHYHPGEVVSSLLRKAPPREVGLLNAMRYLDLKLTLAAGILVKVDRASMAVSLEVRPVYLHPDVLSLAARMPPRLIADRKVAKKALKAALRPWLPDTVLYRAKQGFGLPIARWAGGDLRNLFPVPDASGPLGELLDIKALDRAIDDGSPGVIDAAAVRHSLFFLDRWLARWA